MIPPMITVSKHEKLTVIWNCKNLVTLWKIFLPHIMALTLASKSFSVKIISAYYLTELQPDPIASPTSAVARHLRSSIPSPVDAIEHPIAFRPLTRVSLWRGVALAKTLSSLITLLN